MKLPILSLAILGGQVAVAWKRDPRPLGMINEFQELYTGINLLNGTFAPQSLLIGYVPWLAKRFLVPIVNPGRSLNRMHLPISIS